MISFLEGRLVSLLPTLAEVDVGGVGYEVFIPLTTHDRLPAPPADVRLLTHLVVREDAHDLYGFLTKDERDLFRMLINRVSGVGPKLALAILSGISLTDFKQCVLNNDALTLSRVKGVGRKTAEKIILELRDKIGVADAWQSSFAQQGNPTESTVNDAVLALIALGYKQAESLSAVRAVLSRQPDAKVEDLIRGALRSL